MRPEGLGKLFKCVLQKWDGVILSVFSWMKEGFCEHGNEYYGSLKYTFFTSRSRAGTCSGNDSAELI
jgi:hypothetical protein